MKEMNRREFLTLSGAAVVALSLAGCEDEGFGGSGAPGTPDSGSSLPPLCLRPLLQWGDHHPWPAASGGSRFAPYSGDPGRQKDL